ncbi:MAG: transcriptional regulator [Paenibacillus sp.]|nr:transcriptional regulator [Paenibacillus sp.]
MVVGAVGADAMPDSADRILDCRSHIAVSDQEVKEEEMKSMTEMQLFSTIDWRLFIPVIVVQLILLAVALIDCIRAERTRGPKIVWIPVIVLLQMIGPVLYFVFGKERDT